MFLRDFTLRFTVMAFNVTCKKTVLKKNVVSKSDKF